MRIVCPHCQTAYQLEGVDDGTILVCHRCGTEFSFGRPQKKSPPDNDHPGNKTIKPPIPAEEMYPDKHLISPPPPRGKVRIMPWLLTIVLLITVAGVWFNHDTWLDDPWLRSVLINTGLPLKVRDKDWRIQPKSVQTQRIKRNDGSQVLVIEGRVKNLLQSEIIPPAIHFSIFAKDDSKHLLLERKLLISQPPLMDDIRHAPYVVPAEDHVPVGALGDRGFILVLEGVPENAGDFTLSAIARNPD